MSGRLRPARWRLSSLYDLRLEQVLMGVTPETDHHGGHSLTGVMRLIVEDADGNVLTEGFIRDTELTYDPNPDLTISIDQ